MIFEWSSSFFMAEIFWFIILFWFFFVLSRFGFWILFFVFKKIFAFSLHFRLRMLSSFLSSFPWRCKRSHILSHKPWRGQAGLEAKGLYFWLVLDPLKIFRICSRWLLPWRWLRQGPSIGCRRVCTGRRWRKRSIAWKLKKNTN